MEERLLRIEDVIGDRKKNVAGYIPMSRTKFYDGIKAKLFPAPIRIGSNAYWRLSEIQQVITGEFAVKKSE